ncbi:aspartate aminotransferase family protein, partial [Pseudomonas aeruginosa]
RFVLRWARAMIGRNVLLLFDGYYHGTGGDTHLRRRAGRIVDPACLFCTAHTLCQVNVPVPGNDL